MNRFTKFFCNLMMLGVALALTTPALAGPTAPPTPTATAMPSGHPTSTATPTATPTPLPGTATPIASPPAVSPCTDRWVKSKICTQGKGQSPSNNPKVSMCIRGYIVNPGRLGITAHLIPVCRGESVTVEVTDITGTPTVTAAGSLLCNSTGCTGVVNVIERLKVVSSDGKDTDSMILLPKP